MNFKKALSIVLVLAMVIAMLTACGGKEKTKKSSINPELISAFGEEMIQSEEETIADLVAGLKECYKQYQKDKDLDAFVNNVNNAMSSYKGYLEEISDELMNLYEDAKAEGNKDKMMELLSTYNSSIAYLADESKWTMYMNLGMGDEQDVEQALINYINDISEFFYCKPIAD